MQKIQHNIVSPCCKLFLSPKSKIDLDIDEDLCRHIVTISQKCCGKALLTATTTSAIYSHSQMLDNLLTCYKLGGTLSFSHTSTIKCQRQMLASLQAVGERTPQVTLHHSISQQPTEIYRSRCIWQKWSLLSWSTYTVFGSWDTKA